MLLHNFVDCVNFNEFSQVAYTNEKCAKRDANTALAVVRRSVKFRSAADPLPGGAGRPKFNQLEIVTIPSPTDPVWWKSMHAISSYHGNRPTHTNTQTQPQTHRQNRLQYTASLSLARSVIYRVAVVTRWPGSTSDIALLFLMLYWLKYQQ